MEALSILARVNRPVWQHLMSVGMHQDWSWQRSARQYVRLFERTLSKKRLAVPAGGAHDGESTLV